MIDLIMTPINAVEAQAILGLSDNNYAAAVASGLLRRSVNFEARVSQRTALHSFFDLLTFILLMKKDQWDWFLGDEDIEIIVCNIHTRHLAAINTPNQGRKPRHSSIEVQDLAWIGVDPEYVDELLPVARQIENIWHHLIREVLIEVECARDVAFVRPSAETLLALQGQVGATADQWQAIPWVH